MRFLVAVSMAYGVSSFVDNLYTCAVQADTAVAVLEDLELFLGERWFLEFGADSRFVVQTLGAPDSFRPRPGWTCVSEMKTLGQIISNDGSIVSCVNQAVQQMWGAFHANICPGLISSSQKAKFNFMQSSLMSICS